MQQEEFIDEIIDKFSTALAALDIYVVQAFPKTYDVPGTDYESFEDFRKKVVSGEANLFFDVKAVFGDNAWSKITEKYS